QLLRAPAVSLYGTALRGRRRGAGLADSGGRGAGAEPTRGHARPAVWQPVLADRPVGAGTGRTLWRRCRARLARGLDSRAATSAQYRAASVNRLVRAVPRAGLLDFRLFVGDVLARHRVEL